MNLVCKVSNEWSLNLKDDEINSQLCYDDSKSFTIRRYGCVIYVLCVGGIFMTWDEIEWSALDGVQCGHAQDEEALS